MMNTEQLKQFILNNLDDSKAKDVTCLSVAELTDMTDYMIIATGNSNRHVRSIANTLVVKSKEQGVQPNGVEGEDTGEWVLVDFSDVVVHVMQAEARSFYDLEKLWTPLKHEENVVE